MSTCSHRACLSRNILHRGSCNTSMLMHTSKATRRSRPSWTTFAWASPSRKARRTPMSQVLRILHAHWWWSIASRSSSGACLARSKRCMLRSSTFIDRCAHYVARYVSLLIQEHAALLTLQHADACSAVSANGSLDAGDEKLFRLLLRSADLWVAVNELASGRAADCDGELTVHALGRTAAAALAPASRDELIPLDAFRLDRPSQACLFRIVPDGTGPKNAYGVRSSVKIWSRGSGQGLA